MNHLAKEFGKKIKIEEIDSHTFPEPGKINDLQKIKKCATGFRAKYIYAANSKVDDAFFAKLKKKKSRAVDLHKWDDVGHLRRRLEYITAHANSRPQRRKPGPHGR